MTILDTANGVVSGHDAVSNNAVAWRHDALIALRLIERMMRLVGASDSTRFTVQVERNQLRIEDGLSQDSNGKDRVELVVYLPKSRRLEYYMTCQFGHLNKMLLVKDVKWWRCDINLRRQLGHIHLMSVASDEVSKRLVW